MDLQFLGGATTVTGSRFLLSTKQARVLIDCGMFQGSPNEAIRNRIPLGFDPSEVNAVLLTHAHLDHCGLLPVVVREGFGGPIWATAGTAELARLVLLDSGRLHEEFAKREAKWERRHPDQVAADDAREAAQYQGALDDAAAADAGSQVVQTDAGEANYAQARPTAEAEQGAASASEATAAETEEPAADFDPEAELRSQPPEIDVDLDAPLYTEDDAERTLEHFQTVRYDEEVEVAPGIHATFHDAGHILGSAIIRLRVREDESGEDRFLVFSGDLGRPGTPIVRDPTSLVHADYVIVESTYGGREHEPHDEAIRILAETVRLVDEADGVLLIPSFAIGRTQEIVWELDRLIERGEIPELPLYLDSPMASKASDVYRRHTEYWDQETCDILEREGSPIDYPNQIVVNKAAQSNAIAEAQRPYMIISSNGMLTGGRVVNHLKRLIGDPAATLLFVGYQGEGTLGAHLQAGETRVKINGQPYEVRCKVRSISGFSAHADEGEILDWLRNFTVGKSKGEPGFPRQVFLVHGDPEAQQLLAPKVDELGLEAYVPRWRESVALD